MYRGALHFARIEWHMSMCECFRCTIFTAIYGFEGFVNIILMFNETIINQIVCESKIATMTFFSAAAASPCQFPDVSSGDECCYSAIAIVSPFHPLP